MRFETKTLTMLCPTVLAALFALMSSYYLSVGHVSWLAPSPLDLRFQINQQMKETLLQRIDVLAAELWMQSKLWKDSAPYNSSHQKPSETIRNSHNAEMICHYFQQSLCPQGTGLGGFPVQIPVVDRKLESALESRRSISTRKMRFTAWTCADLAGKADLRGQAQHIRAGKVNIVLVADQNSFSFIFQP